MASEPRLMAVVRAAISEMAKLVGFTAEEGDKIVLAVDEAITNVIKHAYDGAADRPIEISVQCLYEQAARPGLRVSIRDYGRCVDPAKIKGRDLEDVRPGGLGVHIIKSVMDRVDYAPQPRGGTLLIMEKTRGG